MKFPLAYTDWIDSEEHGFYINNAYDFTTNKEIGVGYMQLTERQRILSNYVLTQDEDGRFPYVTVINSDIKKSGKTAWAASVAAWFLECGPPFTDVVLCANSLDQSERLIFSDINFHFSYTKRAKTFKDRIEMPNGSKLYIFSKSATSAAGSRHALTLWDELWGACLSADTLCYSRNGWKRYNELSVGEDIATINPDTLIFEWQPIKKISAYIYDGYMHQLNHRRCDMLATPNHRVFGKFRTSGHISLNNPDIKYEFLRADKASQMFEGRISVETGWKGNGLSTFIVPSCVVPLRGSKKGSTIYLDAKEYPADLFFEFMGYYLSEGNVSGENKIGTRTAINIAQRVTAHPEVVESMMKCFAALGLDFIYNGNSFYIKDKQLATYLDQFGHAQEKFVLSEMKDYDVEYLRALFDAFMDGDGWMNGNLQTEISSKQLIDDLSEIGLKLGYTPRYMGSRMRSHIDKRDGRIIANKYPSHRVSFSTGNLCYHRKNWNVIKYKGEVWCPTVDNGTWLANRNGSIYWTGNTSEDDWRRWDELQPIPTVSHSLRLVSSYAGFYGESQLLYDLYLKGVDEEENPDGKGHRIPELAPLPCYESGSQFTYWSHEPHMPWQTEDYYENARNTERPNSYLRLHENRWTTSREVFIPIEWWEAAEKHLQQSAEIWEEHPYAKTPLYIGIDASSKRDCTAAMAVAPDTKLGKIALVFHKIWTPVEGEILNLEETLEPFILRMSKRFKIKDISCDPSHMYQIIVRLRNKGLPVNEFSQTDSGMTQASQHLFDLLRQDNILAYPAPDIKEHLQNVMAEYTNRGVRIVKDKGNSRLASKKIDAAVALAIACHQAYEDVGKTQAAPVIIESHLGERMSAWGNVSKEPAWLPEPFRTDD